MTLEEQIRQRWGKYGNWKAADTDQVAALASLLKARGVTDLNQLEINKTQRDRVDSGPGPGLDPEAALGYGGGTFVPGKYDTYDLVYGGKSLGLYQGDINGDGIPDKLGANQDDIYRQQAPDLMAWSGQGHGNTRFKVVDGPDGKPVVVPEWVSSSDAAFTRQGAMALAATMAAGYGAQYLQGANAGLSGVDAAMVDMGAGATNVGGAGGGTVAAGGGFGGLEAGSLIDAAAADVGQTLVGESVLTSGGTPSIASTLGDIGAAEFGLTVPAAELANTPNTPPPTTPNTPTTPPPPTTPTSPLTPKNWIDLAKVGTAVVGTMLAGNNDDPDNAKTRADSISDAQLQAMQFALDQSKELADYNRTTFRPVEQKLVQGAMDYATPGRMESAAQEATGRVASEFDATRQQAGREMIRYGMDPTTIAALGASSQLDEAKARAGAANQARDSVEQQGWSRMADVANLGRNIASSQATQQQIGLRAGDSAASNAATSARLGQAEDAMLINGIGQIGNYVGELFAKSDKTKKRGTGKMADSAKALKQIEKTPVHEGWSYKDDPTKEQRIGPMAQDVQRISGDHAAPGGKVIDMVSQQGRMMAAVQELARKVKKLEAAS